MAIIKDQGEVKISMGTITTASTFWIFLHLQEQVGEQHPNLPRWLVVTWATPVSRVPTVPFCHLHTLQWPLDSTKAPSLMTSSQLPPEGLANATCSVKVGSDMCTKVFYPMVRKLQWRASSPPGDKVTENSKLRLILLAVSIIAILCHLLAIACQKAKNFWFMSLCLKGPLNSIFMVRSFFKLYIYMQIS